MFPRVLNMDHFSERERLIMPRILLGTALLLCLLLAACTASDPLNGSGWNLSTLHGQPALSDVSVTLNFQDGAVSGSDGCNSYSSTYQSSDGKLTIDKNIISTMMACDETIMQQASAFTAALPQVSSFKIDGEQLTLLNADGETLAVFTK